MTSDTATIARAYRDAGLSVLPISTNGSKAPMVSVLPREATDDGRFAPVWTPFQERLATDQELERWYRGTTGIGIIGGRVSRGPDERSKGLEILDLDNGDVAQQFRELVESQAPGLLDRLPQVETPRDGGGLHVFARLPFDPPGNQKLAQDENGKTLAETRGECGYVLTVGSPGKCHETGREYRHVGGPPLTEIPVITVEERDILHAAARSFNRLPESHVIGEANGKPRDGLSPGDAFNAQAGTQTIVDMLVAADWAVVGKRGDVVLVRRPGKTLGISGTVGLKSKSGNVQFCCFSSNAHPFQGADGNKPCTSYSAFAVFATLNHGSDFHAAANELMAKGYGDRRERDYGEPEADVDLEYEPFVEPHSPDASVNGRPQQKPERQLSDYFTRYTMPELVAADLRVEYLINGVIPAMHPTFVGAPPKGCKTITMCDLAVSAALGVPFLGRFNVPRAIRVAFFSGESGAPTVRETLNRVARAKGPELQDVLNLVFYPQVPKLDDPLCMQYVEQLLREDEIELAVFDPFYLMLGSAMGDGAGNMFKMGEAMRRLSDVCQSNGVTPIIVHHLKHKLKPQEQYAEPELSDLMWSGGAEFARAWVLMRRLFPYVDGTGEHVLYVRCGSSCGHSSLSVATINEGIIDPENPRQTRIWDVSCIPAAQFFAELAAEREAEANAEAADKLAVDDGKLIKALQRFPEGETKRKLRDVLAWNGNRINSGIERLLERKLIDEFEDKRGRQTVTCYLLKAPGGTGGTAGGTDGLSHLSAEVGQRGSLSRRERPPQSRLAFEPDSSSEDQGAVVPPEIDPDPGF
jgi:putative DNA primase/helicase